MFGRLGLEGLVWKVWLGRFDLVGLVWYEDNIYEVDLRNQTSIKFASDLKKLEPPQNMKKASKRKVYLKK